ncbi:DUF6783 domain-containing protein [Blautia marasmi]|uniref:DUF6783 domain-containing protein n=1 Tax=Blautia marasmi TaxID=1917868 RepID=UPI003AB988DD
MIQTKKQRYNPLKRLYLCIDSETKLAGAKPPTKCDAKLAESNYQTHANVLAPMPLRS